MRKFIFFLFSLSAMLHLQAQKNNNETIEGNGKSVTREISVSSFEILKASGIYELKLAQGEKESVKIIADENLHEYFTVKNDGNNLVINMEKMNNKNLKNKNSLQVIVTFKKLKEMDLKMVGNVASQETLSFDNLAFRNKSVGNIHLALNATRLDLQNKSVGNVHLTGKAEEVVVKNNGVGNLQASGFVVQTMDIDNSGVGNAEVNAQKNLKVKDGFLGKVRNAGAAPVRKMNKVRV